MVRLIAGTFIGALLIAPLGWSGVSPALLAELARLLFVVLLASSFVLLILGAAWSRRWAV